MNNFWLIVSEMAKSMIFDQSKQDVVVFGNWFGLADKLRRVGQWPAAEHILTAKAIEMAKGQLGS